ncbi:MAG: selenium-dependent molybdenum cofactor biosynthesis protein YqeB [Bacillota bacterium]|nr:selenium-dependent molybdenum cofactor biosynthesis protein YqeB [Bacillota bacterium]
MSLFGNCDRPRVLVRGAGDIATGIGHRLYKSGFEVFMTEIERPECVRRKVAFSEAVYDGEAEVEGVKSLLAKSPAEAIKISGKGFIPVLIDAGTKSIPVINPLVVVDAIIAKKNLGTSMGLAPIVIGIGPGFFAGADCHAVIETCRGNSLGRVVLNGKALENTGIPGEILGFSRERVIYASASGVVNLIHDIGDMVKEGEPVARIRNTVINSPIGGVLRGIIRDGFSVAEGMKIGDIDPSGIVENCFGISDKARAVGGGVLEAILYFLNHA